MLEATQLADVVYDWWDDWDVGMSLHAIADKHDADVRLVHLALVYVEAITPETDTTRLYLEPEAPRPRRPSRGLDAFGVLRGVVERDVEPESALLFKQMSGQDNRKRERQAYPQSARQRGQDRMYEKGIRADLRAAGLGFGHSVHNTYARSFAGSRVIGRRWH